MTDPTLEDLAANTCGCEGATGPFLHLYHAVRESQKVRGPMTPEDVLEIARRGSLPAPLRRRDWVIGSLGFFRVIGVLHESDGRYEALHPAAAAAWIDLFADLLTD